MGKKLLADYIRGYMPHEVEYLFRQRFPLTKEQIFKHIYSDSLANRFCAGFSMFIYQHIHIPYISNLAESCFTLFFSNLVSQYPGYRDYSFNCIGSIGYVFSDQLKRVAADFGMQPGIIAKSPMEGLIAYHTNNHSKP